MSKLKILLVWMVALGSVVVMTISGAVLYLVLMPDSGEAPLPAGPEEDKLPMAAAPAREEPLPTMTLNVYFASRNNADELVKEQRQVACRRDPLSQAWAALRELEHGPQRASLRNPLPPGAKIRAVFVDQDRGTAYIDLSAEFISNMPAGISQSGQSVYAVVNTVAGVARDVIREVCLLVDGNVIDHPINGLNLSRPVQPEWSWIVDG